jgi:VWFA-related protein
MTRFARVPAIAIAVLGLASIDSLQSQSSQEPAPVIRAGTRLVEVEVVVRDKNGPVTGLKRGDFTLRDDGHKREIAVFHGGGSGGAEAAGISAQKPGGAGFKETGATVLLFDQLNTSFDNQDYARTQLARFLESVPESGPIAIYMLGKQLTVVQDFTDNRETLAQAVRKWDPKNNPLTLIQSQENMDALDRSNYDDHPEIRRQITEEAIARIAGQLSGRRGRRNLVWLSDTPGMAGVQLLAPANIHLYPVLSRGVGSSGVVAWMRDMKEQGTAGINGPPGMAGGTEMDRERANAALAAASGSIGFTDSRDISTAVRTAGEDARTSYVLGFYLDEETLDNKFHALAVTVAANGAARGKTIDVRYRPGYLAARAAPLAHSQSDAVTRNRPAKIAPTLNELLNSPLDIDQVEITADAAPDPERPNSFQIKVKIDPRDLGLAHENARRSGTIDVSFSVAGKVITRTQKVDIPDDEFDAFRENGIETTESIETAGGPQTVRVVVQDRTTGAAGSVTVPLGRR